MREEKKLRIRRLAGLAAQIAKYSAGMFLLIAIMVAAPTSSSAGVAIGVSVAIAPPALPVYIQPSCPGPGYIWTPGYWAWDPDIGYYWVPGTWVLAPFPGALWTPGYWAWSNGVFVWNGGYWGLTVGFYGGINYGFGYNGYGYYGGYWKHNQFYYNRAVNNVRITNITNVYNQPVSTRVATRVSYNGGRGGTTLRPTAAQLAGARERRSPLTDVQRQNEKVARSDPKQRAAVNRGRPAVAATPKPGVFAGPGVVKASRAGAPYKAPLSREAAPGVSPRTSRPSGVEKRPPVTKPERIAPRERTVPERVAPRERAVKPVVPRKEPERPAFRPSEPRRAPERQNVTRPPSTRHEPPKGKGETKREEGR